MNDDCDGESSSFRKCYQAIGYEDETSWVGSGSGDITIEIFSDASENYAGFELWWKRQDPCEDLECNTGECSVSENTPACQCSHPFSGVNCEINDDPCNYNDAGVRIASECQNGGTCEHDGSPGSDTYCSCDLPFTGSFCEANADPCNYNDAGEPFQVCKNGAACSLPLHCDCADGFTGTFCETAIDPCAALFFSRTRVTSTTTMKVIVLAQKAWW